MITLWTLSLASIALAQSDIIVSSNCRVYSEHQVDSAPVTLVRAGSTVSQSEVPDSEGWVRVLTPKGAGWLAPECRWSSAPVHEESRQGSIEPVQSSSPSPATASSDRHSYGGVFLGTAFNGDQYLQEGGKLSMGALTLLRVNQSNWITGLGVSILGGSRFQRAVTPNIPVLPGFQELSTQVEGLGNVASIYTDIMHVPIASYTGGAWTFGSLSAFAVAGPSAHRIAVNRLEQVTGVARSREYGGNGDSSQVGLTTYSIDRDFGGITHQWAAGVSAAGGAIYDIGKMPFVGGRWSTGVVAMAFSPLGRQHCGELSKENIDWGSICIPLEFQEESHTYYTGGKELYELRKVDVDSIVLPVNGITATVNFVLFFQM
jgi:hypothetical protein